MGGLRTVVLPVGYLNGEMASATIINTVQPGTEMGRCPTTTRGLSLTSLFTSAP